MKSHFPQIVSLAFEAQLASGRRAGGAFCATKWKGNRTRRRLEGEASESGTVDGANCDPRDRARYIFWQNLLLGDRGLFLQPGQSDTYRVAVQSCGAPARTVGSRQPFPPILPSMFPAEGRQKQRAGLSFLWLSHSDCVCGRAPKVTPFPTRLQEAIGLGEVESVTRPIVDAVRVYLRRKLPG